MSKYLLLLLLVACGVKTTSTSPGNTPTATDPLQGAWIYNSGNDQQLLLFADGYVVHTAYNIPAKKFIYTHGGPYTTTSDQLMVQIEFNTENKNVIGTTANLKIEVKDDKLTLMTKQGALNFTRQDDGTQNLSGLWKISARQQGDSLRAIHQVGPRKTIKILSGTKFQWAAINPASKEFSGTGGGSYTFANGKYTEHIEFFSRDSSRVGASLSFDGKITDGKWHHSGRSSKGDSIYEVWSREKQ